MGRDFLPKVWDGLGLPLGGQGRVGNAWDALPVVWDGSLRPPGRP